MINIFDVDASSSESKLTIDIEKGGIKVLHHPRGDGRVSTPHKNRIPSTIKLLENEWGTKAIIMADFRGKLAPKKHVTLTKRQFRKRTQKFNFDIPQDGKVTWDPPDSFFDFWHSWISLKTKFFHGYRPSQQEISEVIPILESLTGGKWRFTQNLLVMYEWSPNTRVKKDLFDYKEQEI